MFERFTERSRQVVQFAEEEARVLKHAYVGTEHILLGLIRADEGLAAKAFESFDVTVEEMRAQVIRIVGQGNEKFRDPRPFTPRAEQTIELALREALSLGHKYVGTEHILLVLARADQGVAARVLLDLGIDADKVRTVVIGLLTETPPEPLETQPAEKRYTSPLAKEVRQTLDSLRQDKEGAVRGGDFERAAELRLREQLLAKPALALERAWAELSELESPPRSSSV